MTGIWVVVGLAAATVCAAGASPCLGDPLDRATLTGGPLRSLAPATAFAPGSDALPPVTAIQGRLSLLAISRPDGMSVHRDDFPETPDRRARWPRLDVDLVGDGDEVIPVVRSADADAGAAWSWIVTPGRAWREPSEGGGVRVALPVALEETNANCLHNGRLLLRFDGGGALVAAIVQFDAEDCPYYRFDAWSRAPASFTPGVVSGAAELIARHHAERAARPPTATLADLRAAYPAIDLAALARAAGPGAVWGLDDGRTDFVAPCPTRAGVDPACDERALPSYSVAKSLVGAQGLMRLEALAPGVAQESVAAHVSACARAARWDAVRLIDLLDMTSGHYRLDGPEADEDSPAMGPFFAGTTAAQKTAFACAQPRRAAPGTHFAYHTADSFLLGVAMTDVLRGRGLGQDVYDDLVRPVWRSLNQSPLLDGIRRTEDSEALPFTGFGLALTRDDAVRAARFLARGGEVADKPWLDPALLAAALQTSTPGAGAPAFPHIIYRHGFWARDVGPLIGCPRPVWVPFMSGYGGISVVLFPNDVRFWSFGENGHFDWGDAVGEVNKIRPLCA